MNYKFHSLLLTQLRANILPHCGEAGQDLGLPDLVDASFSLAILECLGCFLGKHLSLIHSSTFKG